MIDNKDSLKFNFDVDGFSYLDEGRERFVEWAMVREIVGYRRPIGDEDLVCIGIRTGNSHQYLEIHEEMDDYPVVLEKLYEAFPEIKQGWWKEVASWYGENRMTIYGIGLGIKTPAEHYLTQPRKKNTISPRRIKRWIAGGVVLLVMALVQSFLADWIGGSGDSFSTGALATILLPFTLIIISCRYWGKLSLCVLQMSVFYLLELVIVLLTDVGACTLMGQFVGGNLSYMLIPGTGILLALVVLLAPNRRATRP